MNKPAEKSPDKKKKTDQMRIQYKKDIHVFFNEPIDYLSKGNVKVYRAAGSGSMPINLVAFVSDKKIFPRHSLQAKYQELINPGLLKLISCGVIYSPVEKKEGYCFIYPDPAKPLLSSSAQAAFACSHDDVMEFAVKPLLSVLRDCHDQGFFHGEIWPGNLFTPSGKLTEKVKLGDCLSTPSSSSLPVLYEPIERALADPVGRGNGSPTDDLYCFGATLAVLLREFDPMAGYSDEKIIEAKLEKGSYSSLIGKASISGALLELLRGLLYDDPLKRWTLEDVEAWIDGRRLSPKQSTNKVKANRPLVFDNKKYLRPEILSKDLQQNPSDVTRLIDSEELIQWLSRAFEEQKFFNEAEEAIRMSEGYSSASDHAFILISLMASAMYREGPVYYKGYAFMPYGFRSLLSSNVAKDKDIQIMVEIIRSSFFIQIVQNHKKVSDVTELIGIIDSCRAFIAQNIIGFGLERCVYFLDPDAPCLSPILDEYYVTQPEQYILALENLCHTEPPKEIIDRHIAAFLSIKDKKIVDPYFQELRSDKKHLKKIAQIKMLATIQMRSDIKSLPHITQWISNNIEEVYAVFFDNHKVAYLKNKINDLKDSGDISKIAYLLDNQTLFDEDIERFEEAKKSLRLLEVERKVLDKKLKDKDYGLSTGSQIATAISLILACLVIIVATYVAVSRMVGV